jgi:hypothetical protein
MFEKIVRAAEKAADGVSRRDFLGRFGKAALATAAVLGGVLALPGGAQAAGYVKCCSGFPPHSNCPGGGGPSCRWLCNGVYVTSYCGIKCAIPAPGCVLANNCVCA